MFEGTAVNRIKDLRSPGLEFSLGRKSNERRKAARNEVGSNAWISIDGGFAVRPVRLIDVSNAGFRISINSPEIVASTFTLLLARNISSGRRARVIWRRGLQIGAEYI